MQQYTQVVRNAMPQSFGYSFLDENGAVIDLTVYVSCAMELKLQGEAYSSVTGTINSPATNGIVQAGPTLLSGVGEWMAQFICRDVANNPLYGELVQFTVVENVDNATINEILIS